MTADVSSEPDYLSIGGGLALTVDLDDKLVTPRFGVHYSHDTIGRSRTPFSAFHHTLDSAEIAVSADDGKITLRGTVGSLRQKHAAKKDAERVFGVISVDNQLQVRLLTDD